MGHGLGTLKLGDIMVEYAQQYADTPEIMLGLAGQKNTALHNHYLQTWAETGLLGLLSLCTILVIYVKRVWVYLMGADFPTRRKRICIGFFLSSSMMIQNLTIDHFAIEIWVVFAIALAIAARNTDRIRQRNA